jgi:hypothetical protein
MRKLIFIFILVVLVSGCVSARSIYMNASTINYSDGINEKEAKYIAQKFCLDKGIRDVFISFPEAEDLFTNPRAWEIRLQEKDLSQLSYHYTFFIDKGSGEVTYFEYGE